jgi:hypothetical protein
MDALKCKMEELGCDNIFEYVQFQWAIEDHYKPALVPNQFAGIAQGAKYQSTLKIATVKVLQ